MGYTEENTPLNVQPEQPREQPQQPQPQEFYGYPPNPTHIQQAPPNGYSYQGYPPPPYSYQTSPFVVPSHQLYQPVFQRVHDRVGSAWSSFFGALAGFFFPLLSLVLLCFGVKLRLKHGVCIGHVTYYIVGMALFIVAASMYTTQVVPATCHGMHSCVTDVTNGTEPQYWGPYLESCNTTYSYDDSSSDSSDDGTTYSACPLPSSDSDYSDLGAQSHNCAVCVCDLRHAACRSARSTKMFSWIAAPVYLLLAIVAGKIAIYYRKRIEEEVLAAPYAL